MARTCGNCGTDISHLRDDARYCKGACRQAAYRKRTLLAPDQSWPRRVVPAQPAQPSREAV